MKRFYQRVAVVPGDAGLAVRLDGRPVRTPARAVLALPTAALADAVAAEWREQGETIDPAAMPFTGLANAAIDHVAPNHARFAADIARYGTSDLLCYRADGPEALVARQAAAWDPLLDWARTRHDVGFVVTRGILPVEQPPATVARLAAVVAALDDFTLAALSTLVTLSGSLLCGLAAIDRAFDPHEIWRAADIDEAWQVERWGEDAEASVRSSRRATDFFTACSFCAMARA